MDFSFLALPILALLGALSRLIRRVFARRGEYILDDLTKAPVLFLRSFEDDTAGLVGGGGDIYEQREESSLQRMFRTAGPVVTIQKPGTLLPETGAARIKVSDADWRGTVTSLIQRSRFIVIRAGATHGLRWEMQTVLQEASPEKVVLFPGNLERETRWQEFVKVTEGLFSTALPKDVDDAMFVVFDSGWVPQMLGSIAESFWAPIKGATRLYWLNLSMIFVVPAAVIVSASHNNLGITISLFMAVILAAIGVWLMKLAAQLGILSGIVLGALPSAILVLSYFPGLLDGGINMLLLILWLAGFIGVILQIRNKLDGARLSYLGLLDRSPD